MNYIAFYILTGTVCPPPLTEVVIEYNLGIFIKDLEAMEQEGREGVVDWSEYFCNLCDNCLLGGGRPPNPTPAGGLFCDKCKFVTCIPCLQENQCPKCNPGIYGLKSASFKQIKKKNIGSDYWCNDKDNK